MPITVVLAVGLDSSLLEYQLSDWRSAGFCLTTAESVRDAIVHFRDGDFDLVLLGPSISAENRERLTYLIRASGSRVPVVSIADSSNECDSFVDATIRDGHVNILDGIKEIVANRARVAATNSVMRSISM